MAAERLAWITGASSGIGRALALRLAGEGWSVVASARRAGELETLATDAKRRAGRIVPMPLDVTDLEAMRDGVRRIETERGPIALAILNAGIYERDSAESFDADAFGRQVRINLLGAANGLDAIMPGMIGRRSGRIAIVSSVAGYRGLPGAAAYSASKAALIAMAESLRPELAEHNVKLQIVNPGFVRTPLTDRNDFPMPFLMELDDAVAAFHRGLATNRFEISFPWRLAVIMKLLRILPDRVFLTISRRMVRPS